MLTVLFPGRGYRVTAPLLAYAAEAAERLGYHTHPVDWPEPVSEDVVLRGLPAEVLEIEGADHSMHVPGPMAASAAVLGQVTTAVEDFLRH
ncbi:hypothetical protein V5P93_000930 [Actinokineospora auranticolor]|uniref:Alpha/beta hydrolase family protein n=1 Tax=Actinokineospora auranticolor TaxID=155976 RepID=A0A2S6GY74_9PSEU|nr:hypothetical protein [Actinokineospora auranticolor]PPK70192.1 hypothetical protein CLV40_102102 [Actinokineospora auranticolor]